MLEDIENYSDKVISDEGTRLQFSQIISPFSQSFKDVSKNGRLGRQNISYLSLLSLTNHFLKI